MANTSLLRRGNTWFVRLNVPQDRWADAGKAMGAKGGVKREIVRTLQTADYREAQKRRDPALAQIRSELDRALVAAKLRPLTDWTADWEARAAHYQEDIRTHGNDVIGEAGSEEEPQEMLASEVMLEMVEADAEVVSRRRGPIAARNFIRVAAQRELTVAFAARQWLAELEGQVKGGTIVSHKGAFKKLGKYLSLHEGMPPLEGVTMAAVTRRMAGEMLHSFRETSAAETVQRDFSAYSGLWRWAVRRDYAKENPWADQTAGMKSPRQRDRSKVQERGFNSEEMVKLIRAGESDLAPSTGGYAATFWDLIRLCLLTGARPSELLALEIRDVIENGTALALGRDGGKNDSAPRIVPLHRYA